MRRLSGALLMLVLAGAASLAGAQAWPNRPFKFILSQPPGTGPDIISRLFSDRLAKAWGHSVVVENRAGGKIGRAHV